MRKIFFPNPSCPPSYWAKVSLPFPDDPSIGPATSALCLPQLCSFPFSPCLCLHNIFPLSLYSGCFPKPLDSQTFLGFLVPLWPPLLSSWTFSIVHSSNSGLLRAVVGPLLLALYIFPGGSSSTEDLWLLLRVPCLKKHRSLLRNCCSQNAGPLPIPVPIPNCSLIYHSTS